MTPMTESLCLRCRKASLRDVLVTVGCFNCGATPWEALSAEGDPWRLNEPSAPGPEQHEHRIKAHT